MLRTVLVAAAIAAITLCVVHADLGDGCISDDNCNDIERGICYKGNCSCETGWGPNTTVSTNNCDINFIGTNNTCALCNNDTCNDMIHRSVAELVDSGVTFDDIANLDLGELFTLLSPVLAVLDEEISDYCSSYGETAFGCECCTFEGSVATCTTLSGVSPQRCVQGPIGICVPENVTQLEFEDFLAWCEVQEQGDDCDSFPSSTPSQSSSASPSPSPTASNPVCADQPAVDGSGRTGAELVDSDGNSCVLNFGITCFVRCMGAYGPTLNNTELEVQCTSSGSLFYPDPEDLADQGNFACEPLTSCIAWRNTGGCDPNGVREPQNDRDCLDTIGVGASGFCECAESNAYEVTCAQNQGGTTCACECGASNAVNCPGDGGDGGSSPASVHSTALALLTVAVAVLLGVGRW